MSLVICSNEITGSEVRTSQYQSPFSFSNHLNGDLKIPANSQVALQSLKVNKEGAFSLNPASIWYQYFGVKPSDSWEGNVNINTTTSAVHFTDLQIDRNTTATSDQTALKYITPGMNNGVPTPETWGLQECRVKRDTDGYSFEGFDFRFQQRTNGSALNVKPQNWTNVNRTTGTEGGLAFVDNKLTATGLKAKSYNNQAFSGDTPLALNEGIFEVSLADLKPAGNVISWGVGLNRCETGGLNINPLVNNLQSEVGIFPALQCDFFIGAFQGAPGSDRRIRAFHLVEENDDPQYDKNFPLFMREIDYLDNGDITGDKYNWSTNSANLQFDKLRFTTANENILVEMYSASEAAWKTIVNTKGAKATKGKRFKPVADTCRNLYPYLFIEGRPSGTQGAITINQWSGRDITGFSYGAPSNDWWGYLGANDLLDLGRGVDTRIFNQFDSASAGITTEHTFKGIAADGTLEDYDYVMILKPSTSVFPGTERALADQLFGFPNISILDTYTSLEAGPPIVKLFKSLKTPVIKSTTSIFLRLNSFNVNSYNAGQSARSKIIYAAPRFSTGTDQSVGALFFEPAERVYLDLNNTNEIIASNFDIDIVNSDNTLATDLNGKTTAVLHFREKPK
tara:strand:+ start:2568 stop:4436 length:1869 start_codon:yes stop_codon:yes gene_type:complete